MSRDIAVVGLAGIFPGARNLAEYWWNNVNAVDCITSVPPGRWPGPRFHELPPEHPAHLPTSRGGFLPDDLTFDARGFGIMPNVLLSGDPDQFVALQVVADALGDAGLLADNPHRDRTDVIIGRGGYISKKMAESFLRIDVVSRLVPFLRAEFPGLDETALRGLEARWNATLPQPDPESLTTCIPNLVASRVANRLDLHGRAYVVDAACASSLIAVEEAVERLRRQHCDVAVAGGLHLCQIPPFWHVFAQLRAMSPSGMSRPFDRRADGLLLAEGAGAVVLKRWEDALRDRDRVYAVIKGVGSSSDGRDTAVLAPSTAGQARALARAYQDAAVDPLSISYLEAHGTATLVGDQVELETIRSFWGRAALPRRTMGSVKSLIGHAMPAAGIASLLRTILALSNKILPPTLHCDEPRPELRDCQFCVNTETRPWFHSSADGPRRAGVNAFGFGGVNCHVVLEEAPEHHPVFPGVQLSRPIETARRWTTEPILVAGASREDVRRQLEQLRDFIQRDRSGWQLADVAYTLALGLDFAQPCKLAFTCNSPEELRLLVNDCLAGFHGDAAPESVRDKLFYAEDAARPRGKLAFLFPGMGFPGLVRSFPQHIVELCLQFPELRAVLDRCEPMDNHPEDPATFSWILYPPRSLPPEQREALIARMSPPRAVANAEKCIRIPPAERSLSGIGVMLSNWFGWQILRVMGVAPDMAAGTSAGDLSALASGGVLQFEEDVLPRIWDSFKMTPTEVDAESPGCVALVMASAERLQPILADGREAYIAIYVSPNSCLLGGSFEDVDRTVAELKAAGIFVSRMPFLPIHCPRMSRFREESEAYSLPVEKFHPPARFPVYSSLTAAPFPEAASDMRELLMGNWDRPVLFWQTQRRLYEDGARIFVQSGCGTLAANVGTILDDQPNVITVATDVEAREPDAQLSLLSATLFTCGVRFDPAGMYRYRHPRRLELARPQTAPPPAPPGLPLAFGWDFAYHATEDGPRPAAPQPPAEGPGASPPARVTVTAGQPAPHEHPAAVAGNERAAPSRRKFPFVDRIVHFVPEREIAVERVLDLDEDLYLADHHIINAAAYKPLEQCVPLLPMVMMIEALGEVAGHLAPGRILIGAEHVRAYRWVQLRDVRQLPLRLEARLAADDPETGVRRVEAQIVCEGHRSASATMLLAPDYREDLTLQFSPLRAAQPSPLTAAQIYDDGHMFNGPVFQTVAALHEVGENGLTATLRVDPKDRLFASQSEPLLFTDPCVIDGAGQLICVWTITRGRLVLPTGIEKLEFYRPAPPPGTLAPTRLEIAKYDVQASTVYANLEVQDGEGFVWMRIKNWTDRILPVSEKFAAVRRAPQRYCFAERKQLPGLPDDCRCTAVSGADLGDATTLWISRMYLTSAEAVEMEQLLGPRRRQYLLGRIALKDAVRSWLVRHGAGDMVHPAAIALGARPGGQPCVVPSKLVPEPPELTLSHTADLAVAVAGPAAVGIDLEPVSGPAQRILNDFAGPDERALLQPLTAAYPDEDWPARLWCAKEAAGKAQGLGLLGQAFDFQLVAAEPGGRMQILHRPSGRMWTAQTLREEQYILAYSLSADLERLESSGYAIVAS